MSIRTEAPTVEVRLLREGIIESVHQVEATVCDQKGRVLLVAGNADNNTFIRSGLKPFQALAIASNGVLEHYNLNDQDLAIVCSSHQGTIQQARQVFRILWRAEIEADQLQCPVPENKRSPLEHNCSGKHAGMLAVSKKYNWSLSNYLQPSHPVQQLILKKVAEMLQIPGAELINAHDDCGAPTYFMQLRQIAFLYAQLASGSNIELERIVRAMTRHPEMISGPGGFDTELMRLSEGELVSKSGAEGIQCIGRVGQGMGLVIKVKDGAKRAKYAAAIYLLRQMGWISPSVAESLGESFLSLGDYKRLEVLGELV